VIERATLTHVRVVDGVNRFEVASVEGVIAVGHELQQVLGPAGGVGCRPHCGALSVRAGDLYGVARDPGRGRRQLRARARRADALVRHGEQRQLGSQPRPRASASGFGGCRRVGHDAPGCTHPCSRTGGFTRTMRCALTTPTPTLERMANDKSGADGCEGPRYEIRIRGPIGPTIMQAFPTLTASRSGQDTLLTGSIPDQSALYGVIHQLEALGLQLIEIRRPKRGAAGTSGPIA
jgi:hypothetical protein